MHLKLVSWNVNGIRAVDKKQALTWVDEHNIDILALQEIKALKQEIPSTLFSTPFPLLQVSSSSKKGQSGTAIFSHLTPSYLSDTLEVDILKEGRINEFHFENIAFFNVYFPNGQSSQERLEYKLAFYERFLDHINLLRQKGKSIIVCGDVNTAHKPIDLARPKANEEISGFLPIEREWLDKLISHGYVDTFRHIKGDEAHHYSWWSYRANARANNVGWRIDYFFVSDDLKEKIKNAYIMPEIHGSDHCPIVLEIEL